MVKVEVKIKKLHNVPLGIKKGVLASVVEYTAGLETQTKLLAPVDTGLLRSSVDDNVKESPSKVVGRVWTNLVYALAQEFGKPGTKYNGANQGKGYFRPAFGQMLTKLQSIFGRNIRKGIRSS